MMPVINFYILTQPETISNDASNTIEQIRWEFAYRLVKKAYTTTSTLTILCPPDTKERFSEFLWSYVPNDFIGHGVEQTEHLINIVDHVDDTIHTLLNLTEQIISTSVINKILEIITPHEADKILGRQRYRDYQQQGWQVNSHQIK